MHEIIMLQGHGTTETAKIRPMISLGGDKVSMLTHTYPHKPLRKNKVTICNHQADSPLYVWPDV